MRFATKWATIWLSFYLVFCKSGPIKDSEKIKVASEKAKAGDEKSKKALEANLNAKEELSPQIRAITIKELSHFSQEEQVRQKVKPYLHHEDPEVRQEAIRFWFSQKKDEKELIEILLINSQKFSELTPYEYALLGEIQDIRALEILGSHLGKNRNLDIVILESIGKILNKSVSQSPESDQKKEMPPPPEENNKDIFEEFLPSLEKGSFEDSLSKKAQDILLNYAASTQDKELAQKALSIYEGTSPKGYDELLAKIKDRTLSQALRLAILDYLEVREKERKEPRLVKVLKKIKALFFHEKEYFEKISKILGETQPKEKDAQDKEKKFSPQVKKKNLTLKSRLSHLERKKILKLNSREKLVFLFNKYSLPGGLINQMDVQIREIFEQKQNGVYLLLFSALSELNEKDNFFALKEKGRTLSVDLTFFQNVMRRIITPHYPKEWQILALEKIWGVSKKEAQLLREIFMREIPYLAKKSLRNSTK